MGTRAQPALLFGGGGFMKFPSMTSSCLINHGATFSQTVIDKVLFATFPKLRTFQFQSRCRPNDQEREKISSLMQTLDSVLN